MINKILFTKQISVPSKAIFIDRDGVINIKPNDHDYVKTWEDFVFVPGIEEYLRKFTSDGYIIIVVTNQRGIARKLISQSVFEEITQKMNNYLISKNIHLSAVYYCPHEEGGGCSCRKPKPGLILQAAKDFLVDLNRSVIVGDSPQDVMAGKQANVGLQILLRSNSQKQVQSK